MGMFFSLRLSFAGTDCKSALIIVLVLGFEHWNFFYFGAKLCGHRLSMRMFFSLRISFAGTDYKSALTIGL
ncbi:hypothetical protein C4F50_25385 [Flavobacterium sp. KB82]|uniref:Uncharacterized protein n=1 Tax=Flavobacterium hungaricum TaxID=2082725 RepID=A0ABR9TUC6_9FLAO|nr:hypothetical protein [Flavobacterium hungaricum]